MARKKTNTLNTTNHAEQQDVTDIQKNYFCVLSLQTYLLPTQHIVYISVSPYVYDIMKTLVIFIKFMHNRV